MNHLARVIRICILFSSTVLTVFAQTQTTAEVARWNTIELSFESNRSYANAYTEVEMWAVFKEEAGTEIRRPAFWDGGQTWKIRFAPPAQGERWTFQTVCSDSQNAGLHGQTGTIDATPYRGGNKLLRHGLLGMSAGHRNIVHADGTPFLVVGDTPWALPFRATENTARIYAEDRQQKGFNTALLMVVQPDQRATGPRDRTLPQSFGVAFEDLSEGHLNELNPDYFQKLDTLIGILVEHEIVPVYSPVFQGFGWKGQGTLGGSADIEEYVRFVTYLIARYGSYPALWLANADSAGRFPVVEAAGETFQKWDAYGQPTGNHYSPYDDRLADWTDDPDHGLHFNRIHQNKDWLDFQWAQTGHHGQHLPEKMTAMWNNTPAKGVANGEPTYENIAYTGNAAGWWQGHEAWQNLVHGGTMGVVYGAGGLWNWKLAADEEGWPQWADTAASWKDALAFEGSRYVGYISKAFEGMPFTDMAPRPDLADGQNLLAVPEQFYLSYLPEGGSIAIQDLPTSLHPRWFDPQNGQFVDRPAEQTNGRFAAPSSKPWVLVIGPESNSQ
ncbi:DUF4038 domain-containing protein [Pelagicoccus sp. SDUM812003]|uniref:apiosidase-like domain-containing protein n=1 Tax=Pelagicoccus sp. SDUM812003 TaxID=3041267 RepID=UPI00280FBB71|nr:DUF4038 domain-containing protein [Pelagicoccus sp. SDUM812003]MDQ8205590.1 DUF4038 domain-containing protein [Pelagicoccus sp. SDUM812003]